MLCYLIAFVIAMKQLREPDIWWQLLSGRWMLEHMQITRTDMFSYTMAGQPWINVKWLYEIFIAMLEKMFGPEGVFLLQGVVNILIVYFLIKVYKNLSDHLQKPVSNFFAVISILLFFAIVEYRMAGRPEMISHLLCVVYLLILIKTPLLEWKKVWLVIPLQCLWANMHEGYPVGLVMIGTAAAGYLLNYLIKRDKPALNILVRAILLFMAAVIVVLLNPNGFQLWKQPFEIYRQVWANKYTTELYSFRQAEYWTIEAKCHVILLCGVIIYWLLYLKNNRKSLSSILYFYLLLIPLFGYLSLTANRNIIFSEIVLLPSVAIMFKSLHEPLKKIRVFILLQKNTAIIASLIAIAFYLLIVSNKFYKLTDSPNRYGLHVNMLHNPIGAADFIKQYHITGTPFSDYFVSSYLLWDLYPAFKSYIDLRDLDVFPVGFFDEYFSIYAHPEKFYELDKKYHFNYVVISTSQLIGLQKKLYNEKGFYQVYVDPVSTIFVREDSVNKSIYSNPQIVKLFSWPQPVDDPAWASMLTKLFNPAVNYDAENEIHANEYAIGYYNAIGAYDVAISLGRKSNNDPEALKVLAETYSKVSNLAPDPKMQQAYHDTAVSLLQQAQISEH